MADIFHQALQNDHVVDAYMAATRLGAAFGFGALIAVMHLFFRRHDDRPGGLSPTPVLLRVICSVVTVVIGGNTARAFGLVGALAIVRFRTSIGDTRDTAFVIFSVAVGMTLGSGYVTAAAVDLPVFALACVIIELAG